MDAGNKFRPVAPELVHKRVVAEAFVTSVGADANGWTAHARLPGRHSFHADSVGRQSGYYDPLLVLEALRQGCIAASHLLYDVPLDFHHTVRYYEFSVLDLGVLESGPEHLDVEFNIVVRKEIRRGEEAHINGLDITAIAAWGGTKAMELSGAFGWMPEEAWQRMRAGSRWEPVAQPSATDPLTVGRTRSANVVIGKPVHLSGDGSARAPIVVDIHNPTFFDHPLDHLPGGLILEACRQLSLAELGARAAMTVGPTRLRCDFHSFAEMDAVNDVALTPADDALVFRGEVNQSGQTRATVELAFVTADDTDETDPSQ
ncbi:AfsA-related hotdog domain-containing protein [Mycobacterium sp.]|uniref:AfsA-related hotdog domain-containing protein n=1 Tax=Mycobacterium sp. TaxID=1785 RepID=UPI002C2C53FB|nr:AfsA-related hotdog domain-containing protein [Mycobacterium sp.]HTY34555.1 AfsA-related hotdog domain-containing protein [Mycobacterium sp.]